MKERNETNRAAHKEDLPNCLSSENDLENVTKIDLGPKGTELK